MDVVNKKKIIIISDVNGTVMAIQGVPVSSSTRYTIIGSLPYK
jgi:hypothetical protein